MRRWGYAVVVPWPLAILVGIAWLTALVILMALAVGIVALLAVLTAAGWAWDFVRGAPAVRRVPPVRPLVGRPRRPRFPPAPPPGESIMRHSDRR